MKKNKLSILLLCLILVLTTLTACGSSSGSKYSMAEEVSYENGIAMDAAAPAEAPVAAAGSFKSTGTNTTGTNTTGSSTAPAADARKWIITGNIQAETDDLDDLLGKLRAKISELGGYVEDQSINNGSKSATRRYRNASMTVRIPAKDVDQFTDDVSGMSNVISKNQNMEDITLRYVSTSNRIAALQTEEARLLELMAKAEDMSDLLEIEARLTEVRYELEDYSSRLRLYDNQIDYATIYLSISEVQEYTPVAEPTFAERIANGFRESIESLIESLQDLVILVTVSSPFLLVYGLIILVIVVIVKKIRAATKDKRAAKAAKRAEKKAAKAAAVKADNDIFWQQPPVKPDSESKQ